MSHTQMTTKKTFHFDKVDEKSNGQISINTTIRKIKSLELKSATLNNPNNIRSENNSNIFEFSYNLPTFSIIVQPDIYPGYNESNYTFQIAYMFQVMVTKPLPTFQVKTGTVNIHTYSLLYFTDINQLLNLIVTNFNTAQTYGTLTYSINNNNIIIFTVHPKNSSVIISTISIHQTLLSQNLGFTSYGVSGPSIIGNRPYNISLYDPAKYEITVTAILLSKYDDINSLINDVDRQFTQQGFAYSETLQIYAVNSQDSIQINSNAYNIILKADNNNNYTLSFYGNEIFNRGTLFYDNPEVLGNFTGNGIINLSIYPREFTYPTTATIQLNTNNIDLNHLIDILHSEYLQPDYDIYISINNFGKIYLQIPKIFNNFKLLNNTLGKILGFTGNENLIINGDNYNLYSSNIANINYDSYLNIFINNLTVQGYSSSGRPSTFKIPLTQSIIPNGSEPINSTITKYLENTGFKQYHKFTDNNFSLAYLQVQFFDRFGFNCNISDYDLTISFETSDE
jgi:hypothetical protein